MHIHKLNNPTGNGTHWLNAGMVEAWGKTYLVYRVNRAPSILALATLDDKYQATQERLLFELGSGEYVAEDPRLVFHDGVIYCLYAAIGNRGGSHMRLATIDESMNINNYPCHYRTLDYHEKNWVPFTVYNQLYCIYSHSPFRILKHKGGGEWVDVNEKQWGTFPSLAWEYGEIRGGASPVWNYGLYWHFFHSSTMVGQVKVYFVGAYTFTPDWKITAMTPEPIMGGSPATYSEPWTPNGKISACFPCGCIRKQNGWLISYGWLDSEVRLVEIDDSEIELQGV